MADQKEKSKPLLETAYLTGLLKRYRQDPAAFGREILGYDLLTDLHSDWILYAYTSRKGETAIQAHRGSYKTTAICVVGLIWYLLYLPDTKAAILRKDSTSAGETLSEIAYHYINNEKLRGLYRLLLNNPYFTPEGEPWSPSTGIQLATATSLKAARTINALGATGQLTGKHYDIILADDTVTYKDRYYRAERENSKNVIREIRNVVNPSAKIIFSGTPWHENDAWTLIKKPKKYPIGTTKLAAFTKAHIEKLKSNTTPSLYAANYLLKHIADEGRLFSDPRWADRPATYRPIAWLDSAYQGDNCTALAIGAKIDGNYYITGKVWRRHVVELYGEIVAMLNEYRAGTCHIESNADKGGAARDLLKVWPAVQEHTASINKHIRIVGNVVAPWNAGEIYFLKETQTDFINQIADYQEGLEPDDAPDALAGLMSVLRNQVVWTMEMVREFYDY